MTVVANGPSDEAVAEGFCHGFGLGMDLQLLVNSLQVETDCTHGHADLIRRSFVIVPAGKQLQDAKLVRRQLVVYMLGWANFVNISITRRATSGDIGEPPAMASFKHSSSRAGGVFLSR